MVPAEHTSTKRVEDLRSSTVCCLRVVCAGRRNVKGAAVTLYLHPTRQLHTRRTIANDHLPALGPTIRASPHLLLLNAEDSPLHNVAHAPVIISCKLGHIAHRSLYSPVTLSQGTGFLKPRWDPQPGTTYVPNHFQRYHTIHTTRQPDCSSQLVPSSAHTLVPSWCALLVIL